MYKLVTDISNEEKRPQNPRDGANVFQILSYSWLFNMFKIGRKKDLEEKDLYETLNDHTSSYLGNELEKRWISELNIANMTNRKPSLLRILIQMFGANYMIYGLILFVDEMFLRMSQPFLIGGILDYFSSDESNRVDIKHVYIYASLLMFTMLASMILYHLYLMEFGHCGMKIRVACCSVMFRKTLRLSHSALSNTTTGKIINLSCNDANKFDAAMTFLQYTWIGVLQTIVVTYFLWQEIGVSSLFGVSALLFFIPLQTWLGKRIAKFRLKTANITDERLRLMNEIISEIQMIKMNTWENIFSKLVENARKKEMGYRKKSSFVRTTLISFVMVQTRLQLFISILSYVLLGNHISMHKVYVIISLYNLLLRTMTIFFCQGIGFIAEMNVSIKRIQNFLLNEEIYSQSSNNFNKEKTMSDDIDRVIIDDDYKTEHQDMYSIDLANVTAKWKITQTVNAIENINLTARPGQLVAIVGQVGAGKSSLIQTILRELPVSEGNIFVRGVISYASQKPWLFSGSIQQNIVFNSPMDSERYKQVVKVCALVCDFEHLPSGDRTIVGERGVALSGGQKARINLARAIYKQADIYLLDDPLSAVDSRVGKHLYEKCIKDYLKHKTCILVTHQIHHLSTVDKIVVMKNASILFQGSYLELMSSGLDFGKSLGDSEEGTVESDYDFNEKVETYCPKSTPESSMESSLTSVQEYEFSVEPKQEAESRSFGNISKSVYITCLSAGGGTCKVLFLFCTLILTQILTTAGDCWLSFWVDEEEYFNQMDNSSLSRVVSNDTYININSSNFRQICVLVYAMLTVLMIVAISIRSAAFVLYFVELSKTLHTKMLNSIIGATMGFFHSNSSGRIFNRLSKDLDTVDTTLAIMILQALQNLGQLLGIIFVVGLADIYLMIPTCIITVILFKISNFYLTTSRSIKRLEGVTKSPVFSHLNASVEGLTTVRAYKAEHILQEVFDKYQDTHSSSWYLFISSNQAFGLWLSLVCFIYVTIVVFSFIIFNKSTTGGVVGLAITQIIRLTTMVQFGFRQSAELENEMISVERVLEYTNCPQETTFNSPSNKIPPEGWPKFGKIVFKNFNLRYSPNETLVLKNLNFTIQPTEKIGIVGRTGAGKSSLVEALYRLAINEGNIVIDDIEIHDLELCSLRSSFAIIPQEPVLFSGTLRQNLDRFDEYPDHILWNLLDEVELKSVIESLPGRLNTKVSENGCNFSVGQKQLICLARAIARNNKIIILDEASASIDPQTDALVRNKIKNTFQTCTVLTVAHRLNTVMDSNRVIVLDAGRIVEFDHPHILLENKNGILYNMVEQTGKASANLLHGIAIESYRNRVSKVD